MQTPNNSEKQFSDLHQANQKRWDAAADNWAACADSRGIWQKCHEDPGLVFSPPLMPFLQDIRDSRVAVLGSGDNQAVFALAGLGAKVTSVDISENQLQHARERAEHLGLEIAFARADVTNLDVLESNSFDLVFTGGHVAVWVADLQQYYAEAIRILRPRGRFIVEEYHPVRRIWKESRDALVPEHSYYNRGPYRYLLGDDVLYKGNGSLESFEFHWTISDMVNATIDAGARIMRLEEYGESGEDWEDAPMEGLPEQFVIIAEKSALAS
ncbi:MAG: class I SAM-dependent methyltransferase [Saprospiraceae bacterium]|nr:class I SAM-dependent methyltransferase [Saprospiraceae bacterium]